ncbi:MAG: NFACT family protein [Lachnospiraceae bacterium]|nr:NFACT family protein [Lachnospiraceae bacterium]
MAFDGIVIHSLVNEMNQKITGGRISKIAQPEADELILTIKKGRDTHKLLLSASASLPLAYFTELNKPNPMTAPNFCMLLRKHIGNGKILSVSQPGLERIIDITVEHLDELGDLKQKHLIIELMGKHSNIIFCSEDIVEDFEAGQKGWRILDSIKHIPAQVSSIREVLPGRPYFIPDTMNKQNPLSASEEEIAASLQPGLPLSKALYTGFTGISPVIAEEVVFRAGLDSSIPVSTLTDAEKFHVAHTFCRLLDDVRENQFQPNIVFEGENPVEFSALFLDLYGEEQTVCYDTISEVLANYYTVRNQLSRIRQKTAELRKVTQTHLERSRKKYDLQQRQLADTEKRETYKIYGELLNAYSYSIEPGAKSAELLNYYTNETITVPLDPTQTAQENAQRYFARYNKLKRTYDALSELIQETSGEIEHLESIATAIDLAVNIEDLVEVRQEMAQYGYIKKHTASGKGNRREKVVSKPYHYISSDGFHMYVGKNNYQNDELTFHFADNGDMWFHAKKMPGSHVIVKCSGKPLPDRTYEEAGRLAAYYSKGRNNDKVEVDYIEKKQVKKTPGGAPGFVIYHTNYSMMAEPNIDGIKEV